MERHARNDSLLRQKIILGFPWLTKTNPIIDWQKGTLKWREPKTGKALPKQEKPLRTTATVTEEEDEEEYLNSTQNPLDDTELSVLISTITGNMDNSNSMCKRLSKNPQPSHKGLC